MHLLLLVLVGTMDRLGRRSNLWSELQRCILGNEHPREYIDGLADNFVNESTVEPDGVEVHVEELAERFPHICGLDRFGYPRYDAIDHLVDISRQENSETE